MLREQVASEDQATVPGRSCPLHYRYSPEVFASTATDRTDVLYVVGGLYGNEAALDVVLDLFARERGSKRLVFNGDFNWFNIDVDRYRRITQTVLAFSATRGNVETELADDQSGDAGCGCAYPEFVDDAVVERSNRIMQRLRQTARECSDLTSRLAALPMWLRIDVGDLRVAVVHGDAESLAGWGFAIEHLRRREHVARVRSWFERANVDLFASSHTCSPIFHTLASRGGGRGRAVLNNGAAGMPNLEETRHGLLTRIATHPFEGPQRVYGVRIGDVYADAIAIDYDTARFERDFLAQWPPGSPAHDSYWHRIAHGLAQPVANSITTSED